MEYTTEREDALSSLDTIRSVMVRATRYTHISALGILLGGGAAVGAAVLGWALDISPALSGTTVESAVTPVSDSTPAFGEHAPFLALWVSTFGLALFLGFVTSFRKARRRGEAFWNRKLQFVATGFFPALTLGLLLTAALYEVGRLDLAPGVWAGTYGVGILAVATVLDWEFQLTGWCFLVASAVSLFLLRTQPNLALLLGFGGIHLALGAYRFTKEWQWQRPQRLPNFKI